MRLEKLFQIAEAPPRQRNVLRKLLGASDHPRRHRCRKTQALSLVELGVLKCGESLGLVQKGRREAHLLDEESLREHSAHHSRQRTEMGTSGGRPGALRPTGLPPPR